MPSAIPRAAAVVHLASMPYRPNYVHNSLFRFLPLLTFFCSQLFKAVLIKCKSFLASANLIIKSIMFLSLLSTLSLSSLVFYLLYSYHHGHQSRSKMFTTFSLIVLLLCVVLSRCSSLHKSVDYPGIGFFNSEGLLEYLPEDPFKMEPSFFLYTRENPSEAEELLWNNTQSIESSQYYQSSRLTKVIIHGYVETPNSRPWMKAMKDKFLEAFDFNVIIIDWSKNNANRKRYGQSAANTQVKLN